MKGEQLKFFDSFGKRVRPGDMIEILSHYTYHHLKGMNARVHWDDKVGVMRWTYQETRRGKVFSSTDDFYGVHQFKRLNERGGIITRSHKK